MLRGAGGAMTLRDRLVLAIVGGGALGVLGAGMLGGPWPALVLGVVVVLVAAAAYRIQPPRFDEWPWPDEDEARRVAAAERGETADQ